MADKELEPRPRTQTWQGLVQKAVGLQRRQSSLEDRGAVGERDKRWGDQLGLDPQ